VWRGVHLRAGRFFAGGGLRQGVCEGRAGRAAHTAGQVHAGAVGEGGPRWRRKSAAGCACVNRRCGVPWMTRGACPASQRSSSRPLLHACECLNAAPPSVHLQMPTLGPIVPDCNWTQNRLSSPSHPYTYVQALTCVRG
jgi:hypothetical protein